MLKNKPALCIACGIGLCCMALCGVIASGVADSAAPATTVDWQSDETTPTRQPELPQNKVAGIATEFPATSLPAIVEPARSAVMTTTMPGVVHQLHVQEGTVVTKGQLLAVIDDQVARASVRLAQANAENTTTIRTAEVELRVAQSNLERLESVRDRRAISAVQIDRARANVQLAQVGLERAHADLQRARLELELQKARLETHCVRAPFDGIVQQIDIEEGQSLSLGQTMLQVADVSELRAELFVTVDFFGQLEVGDRCQLAGSAPVHRNMTARIQSIDPVIDAATRTFRCVFEVENSGGSLPAGFKVSFQGPTATAQTAGTHTPRQ